MQSNKAHLKDISRANMYFVSEEASEDFAVGSKTRLGFSIHQLTEKLMKDIHWRNPLPAEENTCKVL